MHLKPATGSPQPVGQAIVDHLFAETKPAASPSWAWPARAGQRGVASGGLAAALNGKHVGLACREGLFLGTRCVEKRVIPRAGNRPTAS